MKRFPHETRRGTIPPEDGRNIDSELGRLAGEGALQRVRELEPAPVAPRVWPEPLPSPPEEIPTYYGVPALKEPVWKWYIPAYFYVGGLSGAAAVVGASADLFGDRGMSRLSRQCRIIAATGAAASAALLIADLGRPARFLNMLRVFRPSSPMNVGTWFLSAFGTLSGLAAFPALFPTASSLRRVGDVAWIGAGLVGLPMTGYTGVLLAGTAVPIWQGARRSLPVLFSSSGAASLASVFDLLGEDDPGAEVTHRVGIVAKVTELAMTVALEREVALVSRVARPLKTGFTGTLWRSAQIATAASLVLSVAAPKRTWVRRVAGVLGIAGALAMRFSLFHAGKRSARDAKATFEQQRAGLGAAEVMGRRRPQVSPADTLNEGARTNSERSE